MYRTNLKPEAASISRPLCIRNEAELHNNHLDRTCGRVIEMDLRRASKYLRVHVTGDFVNILRAVTGGSAELNNDLLRSA